MNQHEHNCIPNLDAWQAASLRRGRQLLHCRLHCTPHTLAPRVECEVGVRERERERGKRDSQEGTSPLRSAPAYTGLYGGGGDQEQGDDRVALASEPSTRSTTSSLPFTLYAPRPHTTSARDCVFAVSLLYKSQSHSGCAYMFTLYALRPPV